MKFDELKEKVINLKIGEKLDIYKCHDGTVVFIERPKEVGNIKDRETYDVKTNFQIWLREPNKREFRPNHLRILIDLDLKLRYKPELKNKLMQIFDKVYYGEDPISVIPVIKNENFPTQLNSLECDVYLAQLFLAEQLIAYQRESKYDPKNLFFQGFIRMVLSQLFEIDKVCWMAIAKKNPAAPYSLFTYKDNKKNKKYDPHREELWYTKESKYLELAQVQKKLV